VIRAGSLAERAGLRVGDVVYAVNDQRIGSLEQFTRIVAARPGQLGLLVRRGATDFYVPMEIDAAAPPRRLPAKPQPPRDTLLRT
jgi:S1-C subfamily serine protease